MKNSAKIIRMADFIQNPIKIKNNINIKYINKKRAENGLPLCNVFFSCQKSSVFNIYNCPCYEECLEKKEAYLPKHPD